VTSAAFLEELNGLPSQRAVALLLDCCASSAWAGQVEAARPFASVDAALDASDAAFATVDQAAVDEALRGHPRIGERAGGQGRAAAWSRQEQAAVDPGDDDVSERIRRANVAYEERFDRVFLVRAAGRGPEEILAEVERRLGNDDVTEALEVREQLRQITRLRLERLLTEGADR
jgi:2-oxo-4-hydroxy-4-carboxy-5-ureidoimidazoline decarboxylase